MDMMQVKKTVSKNVAALLVMGMAVTMGAGMMQTAEAAAFDPNRPAAMQQGEDRRAPQAKEKTPNKKVKKAPKKEAERRSPLPCAVPKASANSQKHTTPAHKSAKFFRSISVPPCAMSLAERVCRGLFV